MSAEDVTHHPDGDASTTDQVPEFESAALAVQNCLGRCKLGLAKVDMFCGTTISAQFVEVEKIYNDILYLSTQGSVESENKDLESEATRDESVDIKKRLEKLEEGIMGAGAVVVAENSKLKAELSIVLPHIQSVIQNKERETRQRVSETQEETLDGGKYPQHITRVSERNKDEVDIDISTIKLFKECSSILSILGAISNPPELHFNQTSGEYLKSVAEILDFVGDRVRDRRPQAEAELQEHYALLDELSTLIDRVVDLDAALETSKQPTTSLIT